MKHLLIEPGTRETESLAAYRARGGYRGLAAALGAAGGSQAGANVSQPGANVSQPGANGNQPGATVSQPGANGNQPGAIVSQPGANGNQPGAIVSQPGAAGGQWVLQQLRQAGLRGRGGSGQGNLVHEKWAKVARSLSDVRYVVANGAEGSPVSEKDRYLMRLFPHRVLEGLLIACVATGARQAWIYIRGDSEESLEAMDAALAEAQAAGIYGPGTSLDVEIGTQAAAVRYIAGEETAVIDALEGLEGLPQPKPPRPEEIGLKGSPTAVNNVETLAAAAAILREGVAAFRAAGTQENPGTALFTVSGDVARPGVYEAPYGTPLSDLLAQAGAPAAADLLAVLPGGLSSGPLHPGELDVPLTFEDLAAAGSTLGNAAVVVMKQGTSTLAQVAAETAAYLADASCGQCQGCREGNRRVAEALAAGDPERTREYASVLMYGRGNCAHPTGAARFAMRAVEAFPDAWRSR